MVARARGQYSLPSSIRPALPSVGGEGGGAAWGGTFWSPAPGDSVACLTSRPYPGEKVPVFLQRKVSSPHPGRP
jgi:hypothetical protein